jgi:hypothetical protein
MAAAAHDHKETTMAEGRMHRITESGPVHDEREIEAVLKVLREDGLEDLGKNVEELSVEGRRCWPSNSA